MFFVPDGVELVQCANVSLNLACGSGYVVTFSDALLGRNGGNGDTCAYNKDDCTGSTSGANQCRWKENSCEFQLPTSTLSCGPASADYIAVREFQCISRK